MKTGSEAGLAISKRFGLTQTLGQVEAFSPLKLNIVDADMDFRKIVAGGNAKIIGFSGWSKFSQTSRDLLASAEPIAKNIERALLKIHKTIKDTSRPTVYATAGNDPIDASTARSILPFETYVHRLPKASNIHYLALTAAEVNPAEIQIEPIALSFVSPTWSTRTYQLAARVDVLISAGGNETTLEQVKQGLALPNVRQLRILGANTLTDQAIIALAEKYPDKIACLTPKQILSMSSDELLKILGMQN